MIIGGTEGEISRCQYSLKGGLIHNQNLPTPPPPPQVISNIGTDVKKLYVDFFSLVRGPIHKLHGRKEIQNREEHWNGFALS